MTARHNTRQHSLNLLSTSQHVQLLHEKHNDHVFICTMPEETKEWTQTLVRNNNIEFIADSVASFHNHAYISQAGFKEGTKRKTISNVSQLPCFYVDLDYYNLPELKHFNPVDLLHHIQEKETWLPLPTMVADSGRGAYFIWVLDKPVNVSNAPGNKAHAADALAKWLTVNSHLTSVLSKYGGDTACNEASRVLRLAGSTNVKAALDRQKVSYWSTSNNVTMEGMCKTVRAHVLEVLNKQPVKPVLELIVNNKGNVTKTVKKPVTTVKGAVTSIFNDYTLNTARASDYRTLAAVRGGDLADYRHRFLFCYAVAIAWTCKTPESMTSELINFGKTYFKKGKGSYSTRRLKSRVKSIVDRFIDQLEGRLHTWAKADPETGETMNIEVDPRYKLKNKTIAEMLNITPEEETELLTIISPAEKKERKQRAMQRVRRAAGVKPRSEYLKVANKNRQLALQLRLEGLTQRAIATELKVSNGAVEYYLKQPKQQ